MAFDRPGSERAPEDGLKSLAKIKDVFISTGKGSSLCTTAAKLSSGKILLEGSNFQCSPVFQQNTLVFSHFFLFQPCLACHNQAIKQLVLEGFIAKISIWEGDCIYAIHNIRVLQTAWAYSNYRAHCQCNPPSSRGRKCPNSCILPNSNYFCNSFSLVCKMLMFTFLFLCRL